MDMPLKPITLAVRDHLAKLETHGSAEQIRGFFQAEKIQGIRGRSLACPVHNYLTREGCPDIAVATMRTEVPEGWVLNPPAVSAFITAFDDGRYPELETL